MPAGTPFVQIPWRERFWVNADHIVRFAVFTSQGDESVMGYVSVVDSTNSEMRSTVVPLPRAEAWLKTIIHQIKGRA